MSAINTYLSLCYKLSGTLWCLPKNTIQFINDFECMHAYTDESRDGY